MKTRTNYYLLGIFIALIMSACHQEKKEVTSSLSKEDSLKIAFYDRFFGDSDNSKAALIESKMDRPVNPDSAQLCVDNFVSIRKTMNPKVVSQLLKTNYISFNLKDLKNWLQNDVGNSQFTDIRIYFGAYTKDVLRNAHKPDTLENRLTVFLWPYNKNNPSISRDGANQQIQPYNFGELNP